MKLYHIVMPSEWEYYKDQENYFSPTFEQEGFIHLSEKHQVAGVLSRYYVGVPEVLLLHLDKEKLHSEVVFEPAPSQELFPHLYGAINKSAIIEVERLVVSREVISRGVKK